MNTPLFQKGDFVTNPKVRAWGSGEVLDIRDGRNLLVYFQSAGEKIMPSANLCPASAPQGGSFAPPASRTHHPVEPKSRRDLGTVSAVFRSDPFAAQEVLSSLVTSRADLELLLSQLLVSVDLANTIAPNAWTTTLFSKGFRFNVGPVESIIFFDNILTMNLVGIVGERPFTGPCFYHRSYKPLPQPQCAFSGSLAEYAPLRDVLASSHSAFIRIAATTKSGHPRKGSSWGYSHSEGLIHYARMVLNGQA